MSRQGCEKGWNGPSCGAFTGKGNLPPTWQPGLFAACSFVRVQLSGRWALAPLLLLDFGCNMQRVQEGVRSTSLPRSPCSYNMKQLYIRSGLLAYERSLQGIREELLPATSPSRAPKRAAVSPAACDQQPTERPISRAATRRAKRARRGKARGLPAEAQEAKGCAADSSQSQPEQDLSVGAAEDTRDGTSNVAPASSPTNVKRCDLKAAPDPGQAGRRRPGDAMQTKGECTAAQAPQLWHD